MGGACYGTNDRHWDKTSDESAKTVPILSPGGYTTAVHGHHSGRHTPCASLFAGATDVLNFGENLLAAQRLPRLAQTPGPCY